MALMVNLDQWRQLPKHYQSVLQQACSDVNVWMQAKYDAGNPAALRRVVAAGAVLRPFSKEVMEASFNSADETFKEITATNTGFKKLYESYTAFRREQYLWWQVAEYSFDSFMLQMRPRL